MSINSKMTAIADAIRGKTGGSAPLTLDQMATEIAGIATGGGGGLAYDMGEFVLDADVKSLNTDGGIPHALGEPPGFVLVWTDDFAECSEDNPAPIIANVGFVLLFGLTGLPQRLTSAINTEYGLYFPFYIRDGKYAITAYVPTSAAYCISQGTEATSTAIGLPQFGSSDYWRAGVTYKYFVSRAWWYVGGTNNAE